MIFVSLTSFRTFGSCCRLCQMEVREIITWGLIISDALTKSVWLDYVMMCFGALAGSGGGNTHRKRVDGGNRPWVEGLSRLGSSGGIIFGLAWNETKGAICRENCSIRPPKTQSLNKNETKTGQYNSADRKTQLKTTTATNWLNNKPH